MGAGETVLLKRGSPLGGDRERISKWTRDLEKSFDDFFFRSRHYFFFFRPPPRFHSNRFPNSPQILRSSPSLTSTSAIWVVETHRSRLSPGPRTPRKQRARARVRLGETMNSFYCKPSAAPAARCLPLSLLLLTSPPSTSTKKTKTKKQAPASRTTPQLFQSCARSAAPPSCAPRRGPSWRSTSRASTPRAGPSRDASRALPGETFFSFAPRSARCPSWTFEPAERVRSQHLVTIENGGGREREGTRAC